METGIKTQQMLRSYGFKSKLILGAMRSPRHVSQAIENGIDCVSLACEVFDPLFRHPVTDEGVELFSAQWKKIPPS